MLEFEDVIRMAQNTIQEDRYHVPTFIFCVKDNIDIFQFWYDTESEQIQLLQMLRRRVMLESIDRYFLVLESRVEDTNALVIAMFTRSMTRYVKTFYFKRAKKMIEWSEGDPLMVDSKWNLFLEHPMEGWF